MEYHPRPKKIWDAILLHSSFTQPSCELTNLVLETIYFHSSFWPGFHQLTCKVCEATFAGSHESHAAGLPWASQVFHKSWALLDLRNPTDLPSSHVEITQVILLENSSLLKKTCQENYGKLTASFKGFLPKKGFWTWSQDVTRILGSHYLTKDCCNML